MAAAASAGYTRIFPLTGTKPRAGYWLVSKGGRGAIVTQHNLPAQGQGFKYYWLGSDAAHADGKLLDAAAKLGVKFSATTAGALDVTKANHGPYELPGPKKGLAALLSGVDLIPLPVAVGALGVETPAAAGAADSAATGAAAGAGTAEAAAGGAAVGTAEAAATGAALLSFIADPHLWVRVVEIVGGVALLAMGLKALTGGAVDPTAPARKIVKAAAV